MTEREGRIITKQESEAGDVAKSLMNLIDTQFKSKRYKDVLGATRLDLFEIQSLSIGEICRVVSKAYSISENDIEDKTLTKEEQQELKDLWALKKRLMKNPMALSYLVWDGWMGSYIIGKQSLDGLSRLEGVEISKGATSRLVGGDELSLPSKIKKLLTGSVMYRE